MALKNKIMMQNIGLILVLGIVIISFINLILVQTFTTELQNRGISLSKNLASLSDDYILTENVIEIQKAINNIKENENDVVYVFIKNQEGNVLAHTFENGFPKDLLMLDCPRNNDKSIQLLDTETGLIYDIAVPILKGRLGAVHIGLSQARILETVYSMIFILILFVLTIMFTGVVLSYFLAKKITKPISEMVKAADEISRGNLNYKIEKYEDEVGELAKAFNRMIMSIKILIKMGKNRKRK